MEHVDIIIGGGGKKLSAFIQVYFVFVLFFLALYLLHVFTVLSIFKDNRFQVVYAL